MEVQHRVAFREAMALKVQAVPHRNDLIRMNFGVGAKTSGSSTSTSPSTSGSTKTCISVSTGSYGGASSISVGVGGNAKSLNTTSSK